MGLFSAMSKIIRKGKCLFLLLLCLCVVAWIATLSNDDTVKPVQEGSNPEDKSVEGFAKMELESEMIQSIEERVEEQSAKESCPEHSPLLRECCLILSFIFFILWVDLNEMLYLKYRQWSKLV